jgi:hypothetical protein
MARVRRQLPPVPPPTPPAPVYPLCHGIGLDIPTKTLHVHCADGTKIYQLTADALAALRQNFGG